MFYSKRFLLLLQLPASSPSVVDYNSLTRGEARAPRRDRAQVDVLQEEGGEKLQQQQLGAGSPAHSLTMQVRDILCPQPKTHSSEPTTYDNHPTQSHPTKPLKSSKQALD